MSQVVVAPAGARGFDTNQTVSAQAAQLMLAAGFGFAIRYLPREEPHRQDLTEAELEILLAAGLSVMAVQHVESESSWQPSLLKGQNYGQVMASFLAQLGLHGTTAWLDLEGVDPTIGPDIVSDYCRAWFDEVSKVAVPGLYVGWHAGLDPEGLWRLPVEHYWSAYNLDSDQMPATRGVQMRQHAVPASQLVAGSLLMIDEDIIEPDLLGGLPIWLAP